MQLIQMSSLNPLALHQACDEFEQNANKAILEWNVDEEVKLSASVFGYKPVGISRYFQMIMIHQNFCNKIEKELTSKPIWDHLDSMYDMAALHESEAIPFPDEDYELPEDEFGEIVKKKYNMSLQKYNEENRPPDGETKSKKPANLKLKSSSASAPVSSPKSPFLTPTPISGKFTKSSSVVKSESKTPSNDSGKVKQETITPSRNNKTKRSPSPFTTKNGRAESPAVKEELSDSAKKNLKVTPKVEGSSVKKPARLAEAPDNSTKKRSEKDHSSKKGKVIPAPESPAKKNSKLDVRKSDTEVSPKKTTESFSKQRSDSKNSYKSKAEEELAYQSGLRKSSSAGKVEDKKRKRQSQEISTKNVTPAPKRRRN